MIAESSYRSWGASRSSAIGQSNRDSGTVSIGVNVQSLVTHPRKRWMTVTSMTNGQPATPPYRAPLRRGGGRPPLLGA